MLMASIASIALVAPLARGAGTAADPNTPNASNTERIEITATRIPEDAGPVPGSITIVTGADLERRGVRDLRGALALAAGVDIAPGGDFGPMSSVPELWGLKEFDAFLLVIDGVPWGGAFVPALSTIDLDGVERIEIVRGPAPVMYGATSFVGVIHVIHQPPGSDLAVRASGGSYGSGSLRGHAPLPDMGSVKSSVGGGVEQIGFREDRTEGQTGHLSWRGAMPAGSGGGMLRLRAEGFWIGQEPGSPHPRVGTTLTPDVPIGSNHNPGGSHLQERRLQLAAGLERPLASFGSRAGAVWSGTVSMTRSSEDNLRGFLADVVTTAPNAVGFRQEIDITDLYFDTHLSFEKSARWRAVVGVDHLAGRAHATGGDFDYFVPLDGDDPPEGDDLPSQSEVRLRNRRDFSGLYAQMEWLPTDRWRVQVGGRLNATHETRRIRSLEFSMPPAMEDSDRDSRLRGSGSAGVTWTAWRHGDDALHLYGSYSDTFKPAVSDLGLDSEAEILAPETASSWQAGAKSRLMDGRLDVELGLFRMDFENLVVSQLSGGGLPVLVNAGRQRFVGGDLEADWTIRPSLRWRTAYSLHDARFRDYVQDFGGVATQLRGNRLEMSARNMASTGVVWSPARGWNATGMANYVGSRFLNKRNTALASDYTTWSAGVGYRGEGWELRLDGENLNDRRPPVSESELGDAQYYRLPSRRLMLSSVWTLR